ncbi:MAG: aldolase/citrate lyase family protein [Eubacteriales bacterium]
MKNKRRTMLFVSGNRPKLVQESSVFGADAVVFDLTNGVEDSEKDCARILVKEAIDFLDFSNVEVIVKINSLDSEFGVKDVEIISKVKPSAIMVSKASEDQIKKIDSMLAKLERQEGFEEKAIKLIPTIETAYALEDIQNIISASERINAVFFDAEGLASDIDMERTKGGEEILYARSRVAMVCRVAGINAIDTYFVDANDYEGLEKDSQKAKSLGFTGKAAVDGRQIDTIQTIFVNRQEMRLVI